MNLGVLSGNGWIDIVANNGELILGKWDVDTSADFTEKHFNFNLKNNVHKLEVRLYVNKGSLMKFIEYNVEMLD